MGIIRKAAWSYLDLLEATRGMTHYECAEIIISLRNSLQGIRTPSMSNHPVR